MSNVDLSVQIGSIMMKSPVMAASGTFGCGEEYEPLMDVSRLGAIIAKGIRLGPWEGNPLPRHAEVPGGLVNAIGLQGPGVDGFLKEHADMLARHPTNIIANIWGTSVEEYAEVAARLDGVTGIDGVEINVSCPNVKEGGASFGADPRTVASVVGAVRARTRATVITKLAPNTPDIRPFVRAAEEAGSDATAISNTMPAMVIDIERRRPVLANKTGGMSGAGLHPAAVKLVYDAAKAATKPIIGVGGIFEAKDAIEFLLAGAAAVAIGTANFIDPATAIRVTEGIAAYAERHGFRSVAQIRMAEEE